MDKLNILYEDNHILAVVKPAGTLAQGDDTGDESLLDICKGYIKDKYNKPGDVFLGLVHRLDRPVSGAMCFARTSKAAARLSEQFRQRTTCKIYHAVVEGHMPQGEGRLTHWLSDCAGRRKKTVATDSPRDGAKKAELLYRVIGGSESRQSLEVTLLTGYKHQIRVQLSRSGCPVVGDMKYDNRRGNAFFESLMDGRAIALHARSLRIVHPTLKNELSFEAPLPDYWPEC